MFQDEMEYPKPYTNDYDREEALKTKNAETYGILDDPAAKNSGYYSAATQQGYTPQPSGNSPEPARQNHIPQDSRSYPVPTPQGNTWGNAAPPQQGHPSQGWSNTVPSQQGYYAPRTTQNHPVPPQGYYTPQAYGNYAAPPQQGYTPQQNTPLPPKKTGGLRTGTLMALTLAIILIFGVGLFAGWQYASSNGGTITANSTPQSSTQINTVPDITTVQGQQEAAIAIIEPSVVELDVLTSQGESIGSGVIIDKNGDIVTNNHVVNGGQTIKVVLNNGKTVDAQLIGTAADNDLAIVHIQPFANMAVATIGDSSKLVVGQEVLAVGNPLGITQTATRGIVSALNRSIQEPSENDPNQGGATINNAIQTDAPINPGNSGGALINLQGELIGIPTLTAINTESNTNANGIGFAIPSSVVKTTIAQILNK